MHAVRGDHVSGMVLLLIALGVGWHHRAHPLGSLAEPGPGAMPLLLALALGALGIVIVLRGGASPALGAIDWSQRGRAAVLLAACAVAAFALERIGYRLAMAALLAFVLGVLERKRPLATLLGALGFAFATYFLFATLLKVPLPRGPWGL